MPLDPQARDLLAGLDKLRGDAAEGISVSQARELQRDERALYQAPPVQMHSVNDVLAPGPAGRLPVRLYFPAADPAGTLVHFHAGGWVKGSIEHADRPCRALARASGWAVASVEYRLAPESQFPAAFEDGLASVEWLVADGDEHGLRSDRVVVGGDSAGGNLAAAVALAVRDRNGPDLAGQLLIYPAVLPPDPERHPSYIHNGEGYGLTHAGMTSYWELYVPDGAATTNRYAAPLLAEDLSGVAPALVVTAEFDPLRDEGIAYGRRLQAAGVDTTMTDYPGMVHGFFAMGGAIDRTSTLLDEIAAWLAARA